MAERLVIRPPEQSELNKPIIFLAGPIQGAPDWQSEAIEIIHNLNPNAVIASPRRPIFHEEGFDYDQQVEWESLHLRRAGKNGSILFWLAAEIDHMPDRAYAQTTRFELAEWFTQNKYMNARVVVGIEDGYSGAKYIRKRLIETPGIPIFSSLLDTCRAAVDPV